MKKGFSLLEIVVSIIVIGLTLVAVPNIISQTSSNNKSALIQQSVMDAKTRMALVLKSPYACSDATYGGEPTPIFGSMKNFYAENGISGIDKRRTFGGIEIACKGDAESIDYFAKKGKEKIEVSTSEGFGARDNIIKSTMITGISNRQINGSENKNVKQVETNATTTIGKSSTGISIKAYAANIGDSPTILSKSW